MPARDFFSFCTSLQPIELRALGELSEVQHLEEGQAIYAAGATADALFIVTRGSVALLSPAGSEVSRCARGDIFGDIEALTSVPRLAGARTREATSVHCFPAANFAQLHRRVPSFFHYLSEQLAHRLLPGAALRNAPPNRDLRGSFTHFDLVTIYQAIALARKSGVLSVTDEAGEAIGSFRFDEGQPVSARFRHLVAEEAFWQLFLSDNSSAHFSFETGGGDESPPEEVIDRDPTDLLIAAVQFRDEFAAIKESMPPSSVLVALTASIDRHEIGGDFPPELLEAILRAARRGNVRVSDLLPLCGVSELRIYQAVRALSRRHLALSEITLTGKVA